MEAELELCGVEAGRDCAPAREVEDLRAVVIVVEDELDQRLLGELVGELVILAVVARIVAEVLDVAGRAFFARCVLARNVTSGFVPGGDDDDAARRDGVVDVVGERIRAAREQSRRITHRLDMGGGAWITS